jgi:hypothetical protein
MYEREGGGREGERGSAKMAIPMRPGRRQRGERFLQRQFGGHGGGFLHRIRFRFSSQRLFRTIIISLAFIATVPPIFFHFRLRGFHQVSQFLHQLKPFKISIFVTLSLNRILITENEWTNDLHFFFGWINDLHFATSAHADATKKVRLAEWSSASMCSWRWLN